MKLVSGLIKEIKTAFKFWLVFFRFPELSVYVVFLIIKYKLVLCLETVSELKLIAVIIRQSIVAKIFLDLEKRT